MKLSFEKRLNDKEAEYKEKYINKNAYIKLHKKYQKYMERINFSPFYILIFLILFVTRLISVTLLNQNNSVNIYSIIYLTALGVIIIFYSFTFTLYHLKRKNLLETKMNEWDKSSKDRVEW